MKRGRSEWKFIHITKTAGTSIEDAAHTAGICWGRFDSWPLRTSVLGDIWHFPLRFMSKRSLEGYKLFTVVRNPYDRCISEFFCQWGNPELMEIKDVEDFNAQLCAKLDSCMENPRKYFHWLPQVLYLVGADGKPLVDHIIRFENLHSEFEQFCIDEIGIPLKLGHANAGPRTFTELNATTRAKIQKVYKDDFEYLKYEF